MRRKDFFEFQQFNIHQGRAGMKVGTDSDLLGTLSEGGHRILDIGTGTGVLSLMLAQRYPNAQITAIEIDNDAVKDAEVNFAESIFAHRITLHHTSFQDYLAEWRSNNALLKGADDGTINENSLTVDTFDSVVCNPPYFHNSLECPDERRLKARHTSSLPFEILVGGAYDLLCDGGLFSVCIPPEVLDIFTKECIFKGFSIKDIYGIKSVPELPIKRYVLVLRKGAQVETHRYEYCMRNSDRTISEWYKAQMRAFHKPMT